MNRLTLNQSDVDRHRTETALPDKSKPVPGTVLKLDDDVQLYGFKRLREYIRAHRKDVELPVKG